MGIIILIVAWSRALDLGADLSAAAVALVLVALVPAVPGLLRQSVGRVGFFI